MNSTLSQSKKVMIMTTDIQRRVATGILAEDSPKRTASKGLAVAGGGGLALVFLASVIPFVGVFGLSIAMLVVAAILFMTS